MVGHACATEARGTIRSESSPSCSESWQILSGPQVLAGDDIVWRSVEKLRESGKRKVSTGEEESLYFCRGAAVASGSKEKKKKTVFVHRRVVCYDFRIYVARLLSLLLLLYYSLRRWLTEDEKLTVISLVKKKCMRESLSDDD